MRRAVIDDWPHIWAMMQDFHASVKPSYGLDEDDCRVLVLSLISTGFVAVTDGGFIAGLVVKNPMKTSETMGKEFLWWATDGTGAALASAFRNWVKEAGAIGIDWSCPADNARVRNFYNRFAHQSEAIYTEVF